MENSSRPQVYRITNSWGKPGDSDNHSGLRNGIELPEYHGTFLIILALA